MAGPATHVSGIRPKSNSDADVTPVPSPVQRLSGFVKAIGGRPAIASRPVSFTKGLHMSMRRQLLIGLALGASLMGAGGLLRAQEEPRYTPDLEQMRETVSQRLEAVADKLGLSDEQKTKIREAHTAYAERCEKCRTERRELLDSELKAMGEALTPEQREIAKEYVQDLRAAVAGQSQDGPEFSPVCETIADRLHAAIDKINLTPDQWTKIREAHAPFAEKHRAQRAERLQLIRDELKSISEVLTPEQREKVRNYIEARMVHSPVAQSVSERVHAMGDNLGISSEQLTKIRETHHGFADQYEALYDERDRLLQEELKAVSAILTPEQREKVSNYFADRVVMVGGDLSRLDEGSDHAASRDHSRAARGCRRQARSHLRAKREDQGGAHWLCPEVQRAARQRRELRQKELDALSAVLTADQREKVKDIVGDQFAPPKAN